MEKIHHLPSMVKFLQSKIDEMEISDVQKKVCRRAIWYSVIKNYGLASSDKRAREAYGIYYGRVKTKPYIKEVFDNHLGKDYFSRKKMIKNSTLYHNLEQKI